VDISADTISIEGVILAAVGVSANMSITGPGGRDVSVSETPSTWYRLFLITNDTGSTVSSWIIGDSTTPTLPVGYTKKRRIGWLRNNASANLLHFKRIGNMVHSDDSNNVGFTDPAGTTSLAGYCPPTCYAAYVGVNMYAPWTGFVDYKPTGGAAGTEVSLCRVSASSYDAMGYANWMAAIDFIRLGTNQRIDITWVHDTTTFNLIVTAYQDDV